VSNLHLIIANKAYSSWSMRPWLALNLAGIAHRETVIPMNTPEFAAARADGILPAGKVPVLWVGDVCIWDSLAIFEYLAELQPALWPGSVSARAVARSVTAEMHSGFQALRQLLPMNVRKRRTGFALTADAAADVARIAAIWAMCRSTFGSGGAFLFGGFSLADCMFAPVVTRFDSYGVSLPAAAQSYVADVLAHPLVQRWYAEAAAESWSIDKYETDGGWL
jgi:glutathione S-transferase